MRIKITDNDISDFRKGKDESVSRVIEFTNRIAVAEARRKGFDFEEINEVTQAALLELISEIAEGAISSSEGLVLSIKRAVWRVSQRYYRGRIREIKERVSIEDIEDYLATPSQFDLDSENFKDQPDSNQIYKIKKSAEEQQKIKSDLVIVDNELIQFFKRNPKALYSIKPRQFEELVACILKDMGYSVELTTNGADGGIDIIATQKADIGELLLIVDCKRYRPDNHVGIGIVRSLYGIGQQMRASMAMLATTSFFTKRAKEFQSTVRHQLSLKDYNDLLDWLHNYGYRTSGCT